MEVRFLHLSKDCDAKSVTKELESVNQGVGK